LIGCLIHLFFWSFIRLFIDSFIHFSALGLKYETKQIHVRNGHGADSEIVNVCQASRVESLDGNRLALEQESCFIH